MRQNLGEVGRAKQKRAPYVSHLLVVSLPSRASGNERLLRRLTTYMFIYLGLRDTIITKYFKENDQFFKFARHVSTELLSSSVE